MEGHRTLDQESPTEPGSRHKGRRKIRLRVRPAVEGPSARPAPVEQASVGPEHRDIVLSHDRRCDSGEIAPLCTLGCDDQFMMVCGGRPPRWKHGMEDHLPPEHHARAPAGPVGLRDRAEAHRGAVAADERRTGPLC